jgi:predicted Zn-dependent protease with MMP-like domain
MPRRKRAPAFSVSSEEFEVLVRKAVGRLPSSYRRLLDNISVVVEEEPSREVLDEMELESEDDLLGLYTGTAKGGESFFDPAGHLPARVIIYRGPIMRLCRTKDEVIQEVQDTVAHEIGHHFGLDDDEMPY